MSGSSLEGSRSDAMSREPACLRAYAAGWVGEFRQLLSKTFPRLEQSVLGRWSSPALKRRTLRGDVPLHSSHPIRSPFPVNDRLDLPPRRSETHLTSPGLKPSAFHRILLDSPLHRHFSRTRAPTSRSLLRWRPYQSSHTFRLHGFSPSWRLSPSERLTSLLHPAADHGVHRVQDLPHACPRWVGSPSRCHALQSVPLT